MQEISGLKNYNIKITLSSPDANSEAQEDNKDEAEEVSNQINIALHIHFLLEQIGPERSWHNL